MSSQPLTIKASGSQAVTVSALSFSNNAFSNSWVTLPVTLSPGQSLTVKVSAQPETSAMRGVLTIGSSAGNFAVGLTETAATATTAHSVSLKWAAPSTGIPTGSYDVDRAVSGSTHFSHIGSTPASVTNWTDYSPQGGQTYQYRVRALDHDGDTGPPSSVITLKIP
ncbi:MAG TPA: fibronectin type III domain-containing protein [Acidobacteriaceae bacterium]